MAYVLGFFAADGSMLRNKRGSCFIEFHITDAVLLRKIRSAIGSNHKIKQRHKRHARWKPIYRLQIGSKEWFLDLERLGFMQKKTLDLRFPSVPDALIGDFVRGYFDGDGCVYFSKVQPGGRRPRWILQTLFTSGSRSFLESLWSVLRDRGVQGGQLKRKARGHELVFSHRDSLALYRLMYDTGQVSSLFLPRKREKLERAIQVLGLDTELRS